MWEFIEDRVGFDVDLVIANAQSGLWGAAKGGSKPISKRKSAAGLSSRAGFLAAAEPVAEAVVFDRPGAPLKERLLEPATLERLRGLARPARIAVQIWTNEVAEALEHLCDCGVALDPSTTPVLLGSSVRYWNTKIGGGELLAGLSGLAEHLPSSTMVTSLGEAIALAAARPTPSLLKINDGVGGLGVLELDPGEDLDALELERRLAATAAKKAKGGGARGAPPIGGAPLILQELVGGDDTVSPSADYWIDAAGVSCVALAEQVLDGYAYRGARFPGRLEPASGARCVEFGRTVAEALRERGYRGLLNVDFLVDGGSVWVIEMNVRQSAPLDQSLRMTRKHGVGWRERVGFSYLEAEDELVEH